jgi:hypothetical protein
VFEKIKPKKTNKTSTHRSLLKADIDKIHSYLKTTKIQYQKHNTPSCATASQPRAVKSTPRTIDTHDLINLQWKGEKRGKMGKESIGARRRES